MSGSHYPYFSIPLGGIDFIVVLEFFIEIRFMLFQMRRFFEEGFRGNSEEFRRIRRAVLIKSRCSPIVHIMLQLLVTAAQNTGPSFIVRPCPEIGCAVDGAIFMVELMGEFMEDHIVSVPSVPCPPQDMIPRKNHRSLNP